ncbi:hypothetical protein HQ524_03760 [Candidatus Uhrbacteria bacterium]|nr:hypothetical protein [Candidatus Uhrbacteria bacterium]
MNAPKGLTLTEGLVVGGIIVILLFATGISVSAARERVRDYKRLSDVSRIQASLELFFNEQNAYPGTEGVIALGDQGARCLSSDGFGVSCPPTGKIFMNPVPTQTSIGISGSDLQVYGFESSGKTYVLSFMVERAIPQTDIVKGLVCAYPGQAIIPARNGVCSLLGE